MDTEGWGSLGFWIFLAAIVVANIWRDARQKAEKHETLRRIVEKTGTIDEAKLKELFSEASSRAHSQEQKPGGSYRALRILGTIVMFFGAGLLTFFLVTAGLIALFGDMRPSSDKGGMFAAFAACAGIAIVGYGLFFSSRFAEPPAR